MQSMTFVYVVEQGSFTAAINGWIFYDALRVILRALSAAEPSV